MPSRLRIRSRLVRHGSRSVLLTYPGLRLGNYLYFALQAYVAAGRGRDLRVLDTGLGEEWYVAFPALADLMVTKIGPFDRREDIPPLFYQAYGEDFTSDELAHFIRDVLAIEVTSFSNRTLTVNVRRGDYYASAERARVMGFDIVQYLDTAIGRAEADGPLDHLRVVSDDVEWAASAVAAVRPGWDIEPLRGTAVADFTALARSPRLILANSTFSYWGAYVSDVIHGQATVYAPDLHSRDHRGGRAWQHAPSWVRIPTVPMSEWT